MSEFLYVVGGWMLVIGVILVLVGMAFVNLWLDR